MRTTNPSPHAALASCRQEGVHGAASPCRVPPHPTKPTRSRQPPPVRRVSAVRGSWGGSLLGSGGLERGAAHIFLKTKPWSSDPPWACGDPGCCPSSCCFPLFPPPHLSWEPSRNGVLAGCPAPPPRSVFSTEGDPESLSGYHQDCEPPVCPQAWGRWLGHPHCRLLRGTVHSPGSAGIHRVPEVLRQKGRHGGACKSTGGAKPRCRCSHSVGLGWFRREWRGGQGAGMVPEPAEPFLGGREALQVHSEPAVYACFSWD